MYDSTCWLMAQGMLPSASQLLSYTVPLLVWSLREQQSRPAHGTVRGLAFPTQQPDRRDDRLMARCVRKLSALRRRIAGCCTPTLCYRVAACCGQVSGQTRGSWIHHLRSGAPGWLARRAAPSVCCRFLEKLLREAVNPCWGDSNHPYQVPQDAFFPIVIQAEQH